MSGADPAPESGPDGGGTVLAFLMEVAGGRRLLAELRDAVRGSPDHLVAAADRVVATKDPAAITAFVRGNYIKILEGYRQTAAY